MTSITFLEVDREDQLQITSKFPEARILTEALTREAIPEECRDAEIISSFIYSTWTREVIASLPHLKLLCTRSVGYNHIDLDACTERGITVCNVPDYGSHVIAEHVFALLLSTIRHIGQADEQVESGEFDYHGLRGMALRGKTIGIVGTGQIGACTARIAHGFGMKILASDRCRKTWLEEEYEVRYTDFQDMLQSSDIISLHAPSTDETHHMINDVAFHRMKKGVILVNTARGELIDTAALIAALKGGKVLYALLDVMENEKSFEQNAELIAFPNVVTTPHIAFYADESMHNMYEDCFDSIDEWMRGEKPSHALGPRGEKVCDMPGFIRESEKKL